MTLQLNTELTPEQQEDLNRLAHDFFRRQAELLEETTPVLEFPPTVVTVYDFIDPADFED